MTEDIFRIVVAAAVGLACIMFVVQAVVAIALYRVVREMQRRTGALMDQAAPVIGMLGPVIDRIGPVIDQAGPVIGKLGPAIDQVGLVIGKLGPVIDQAGLVIDEIGLVAEKAGPVADHLGKVLATTNRIVEEARPRISEISTEAVGIAKSGRQQVERIGGLLNDASERARTRLEQIDRTVESTVGQVEEVGDAMKRAVMRPVREVNGLAAGISAAVTALVHGQRKARPDAATQDEEMFI